ncbi:MAG: prephenate dehydratase [Bacteroidetes bacterium]|nr:prephenate dehydratase [Bacteroidota bacterium]
MSPTFKRKRKLKVAFQGEKGAYSEIAAMRFFPLKNLELIPCKTFADVFHAVEKGKADNGMVPVENTLNGGIREVFNLLDEEPLYVHGEIKLKISHVLLAMNGAKFSNIKKVYSHPQALLQCRKFIRKAKLTPVEFYDTAGAAKFVSENNDRSIAAIASEAAAEDYGLAVLKRRLESDGNNFTRFLVISRKYSVSKNADKTTVIFSLRNMPGALHKVLSVFAIRDIDLLAIDSIPIVGKPWEYKFYVDFSGSILNDERANAVNHLREVSPHVKVVGSYKSGETIV